MHPKVLKIISQVCNLISIEIGIEIEIEMKQVVTNKKKFVQLFSLLQEIQNH